jgi:hypothetical protein
MAKIVMVFFEKFRLSIFGMFMDGAPDFLLQTFDSYPVVRVNEGKRGEVREERSFYKYIFVAEGNHLFVTVNSFIIKRALNVW